MSKYYINYIFNYYKISVNRMNSFKIIIRHNAVLNLSDFLSLSTSSLLTFARLSKNIKRNILPHECLSIKRQTYFHVVISESFM